MIKNIPIIDWQQDNHRYHQCRTMFEQAYPQFQDAGIWYQTFVEQYTTSKTRLLDLGCGHTSLATEAISQAGQVVGVDNNLTALQHNQLIDNRTAAIGEQLPLAHESFDLIISQWVVEHLPHPLPFFQEMARILRPKGNIILFTTNAYNYVPLISQIIPHRLQAYLLSQLLQRPTTDSFPTFFRANTLKQLTTLAEQSGLTIQQWVYVGNPFYLAFSRTLFRLALLFEQVTDWLKLEQIKLYLVVRLEKQW